MLVLAENGTLLLGSIPSSMREKIHKNLAGLYCPVAAVYRVISCTQWSKENCVHFVPFYKQAALVLAASGHSIDETFKARLSHPIVETYISLANERPSELQSFTDVYTKAIAAIPANAQFCLLLNIDCKCAKCQQPEPVTALPLHSFQDSQQQPSLFADLGQLTDLAISQLQGNSSPRNDTCFLHVPGFPNFFCVLTQKTREGTLAAKSKSQDDLNKFLGSTIQVRQHTYQVIALALHDPIALHYLVVHHAKEQQQGDSIFLYDSIQGVQSKDIWATLLSRPELQIKAIQIRSAHVNAFYPAIALQNSLPEIIKQHAEPEERKLHQPNGTLSRENDQQCSGKNPACEGNPALANPHNTPNLRPGKASPDLMKKIHLTAASEIGSDLANQIGVGRLTGEHRGASDEQGRQSPVTLVEEEPKSQQNLAPANAHDALSPKAGKASPDLSKNVHLTSVSEISPDPANQVGMVKIKVPHMSR